MQGIDTTCTQSKKEEGNACTTKMQNRSSVLSSEIIANRKRDEMSLLQPSLAPFEIK